MVENFINTTYTNMAFDTSMLIDTIMSTRYVIGLILLISSGHWLLIQLYNYLCINFTLWGFITNIVYMGSPVCQLINEVQFALSKYYITIITGIASSFIAWLSMNTLCNREAPSTREHND